LRCNYISIRLTYEKVNLFNVLSGQNVTVYLTVSYLYPTRQKKNKCCMKQQVHCKLVPASSDAPSLTGKLGTLPPWLPAKSAYQKINYVSDIASAGVGLYPVY
jgi:hypothetical protein